MTDSDFYEIWCVYFISRKEFPKLLTDTVQITGRLILSEIVRPGYGKTLISQLVWDLSTSALYQI